MVAVRQLIAALDLDSLAIEKNAVITVPVKDQNTLAGTFDQGVVARGQVILFEPEITGACSPNPGLLAGQQKLI